MTAWRAPVLALGLCAAGCIDFNRLGNDYCLGSDAAFCVVDAGRDAGLSGGGDAGDPRRPVAIARGSLAEAFDVALGQPDGTLVALGRFSGTLQLGPNPLTAQGSNAFLARERTVGGAWEVVGLKDTPSEQDFGVLVPVAGQLLLAGSASGQVGQFKGGSSLSLPADAGVLVLLEGTFEKKGDTSLTVSGAAHVTQVAAGPRLAAVGWFSGTAALGSAPSTSLAPSAFLVFRTPNAALATPPGAQHRAFDGDGGSSRFDDVAWLGPDRVVAVGSCTGTVTEQVSGQSVSCGGGSRLLMVASGTMLEVLKPFGAGTGQTRVAASPSGGFYVASDFSADVVLPGLDAGLRHQGGGDVLVAAVTAEGNVRWALSVGDDKLQSLGGLAVDAEGELLLAGTYQGAPEVGGLTLAPASTSRAFVARLSPDGVARWVRSYGSDTGAVRVRGLTLDARGNPTLSGSFTGSPTFYPGASVVPAVGEDGFALGVFR